MYDQNDQTYPLSVSPTTFEPSGMPTPVYLREWDAGSWASANLKLEEKRSNRRIEVFAEQLRNLKLSNSGIISHA